MQQLPAPVLFHPLKHHLGYIREFVEKYKLEHVQLLREQLRTIGNSQLDLYFGPLSPLQIVEEAVLYLQENDLLRPEAFHTYLGSDGFRLRTLSDGAAWTLRWGLVPNRHVHLHPARYAQHTVRVKANHLKTAIAASIASIKYKRNVDLELLNQVRVEWLELSPVKSYTSAEGLGSILQLVQEGL